MPVDEHSSDAASNTRGTGVRVIEGVLHCDKIGPFTADGPIDFNNQPLQNVQMGVNASVADAKLLSATQVRLLATVGVPRREKRAGDNMKNKEEWMVVDGGDYGPPSTDDERESAHKVAAAKVSAGAQVLAVVGKAGELLPQAGIQYRKYTDAEKEALVVDKQPGEERDAAATAAAAGGVLEVEAMAGFRLVDGEIDMGGRQITNARVVGGALQGVAAVEAGSVTLLKEVATDAATHGSVGAALRELLQESAKAKGSSDSDAQAAANGGGRLLVVDSGGKIVGSGSNGANGGIDPVEVAKGVHAAARAGAAVAVRIDGAGVLHAPRIGGFTATGPINFNAQPMLNVAIGGGAVTGLVSLSTRKLALTDGTGKPVEGANVGALATFGEGGVVEGTAAGTLRLSGGELKAAKIGGFILTGAVLSPKAAAARATAGDAAAAGGADAAADAAAPAAPAEPGTLVGLTLKGGRAVGLESVEVTGPLTATGGGSLTNVAINGAPALSLKEGAPGRGKVGELVVFGPDGSLISAASVAPEGADEANPQGKLSLSFDRSTGTLTAPKIGGFTLAAEADFANQKVKNVALEGGTISGMASIEAQELVLSSAVASGEVGQLLITGTGGTLKGAGAGLKYAVQSDTLTVANLGAFKATGPIDFDNQPLVNMK
jgi:hypothetical protein